MAARYSIVIPTLNEEKFLPKLLDSLVAQTDKNFEVIVVDGSSKDKTVAIAKTYAKKLPKLSVVVSETASLPLQRNLGVRETHGEWLVFIDADSIVFSHFIRRIDDYIQKNHPKFLTSWFCPDSETTGDAILALLGNIMFELSIIIHRPASPGPLTIVKRSAFDAIGGYDETHAFHEDVDLSLRLTQKKCALHILPETLYVWSFRRFRKQGTLQVAQKIIVSTLPVLLFQRPFKHMPGYVMGGQEYWKKKKGSAAATIQKFERNIKSFLHELFE